jgi:hypothetical protein
VNSLKGASARILRRNFTDRMKPAIMHGHYWHQNTIVLDALEFLHQRARLAASGDV